MKLNYVPLMRIQRELQGIPRGMGRFRQYLRTISPDGFTFGVFVALVLTLSSCQQGDAPPTAVPAPTFSYVKQKEGGCADLYLYKGSADDLEVLWISADKEKLKLPGKGSSTFDLAAAPDGLQVAIDLWEKAPRFSAYCNDISPDTKKKATWRGKKGKLTITIWAAVEPAEPGPKKYKASARLEGVVFEDSAGNQATLKEETITEALVGWFAG